MNGFEIGMIILAMALGSFWLCSSPDPKAIRRQRQMQKEADAFNKVIRDRYKYNRD